jgi:hypothetical protein
MTIDELGMNKETVRTTSVQYVAKRTLAAKLVQPNLTEEQQDGCLTLCMGFEEQIQEDNLLDRVITGD